MTETIPDNDKVPTRPVSGQSNADTLLVVTALQIEQQKIDPRPEKVRAMIDRFRFRAGSTYSRLEAKRSWVQRLAYIHTESKNVHTIPQLLDRIGSKLGSNLHLHRKLTTAIEAISACEGKITGSLSEKGRMERFRYFIVDAVLSLNTWWDRSVHHEFDGTKCVRAREKPTFDRKSETVRAGIPRCIPSKIQCEIHNFISANAVEFNKVVGAVNQCAHETQDSAELKIAAQILERAKGSPTLACDNQVCSKLGDCLIAIDGIAMSHYGSTNDREWIPLSLIFGKQYVNPGTRKS